VAQPGQTIENPPMGGRIVFRDTATSTHGELLRVDFFLAPGSVIAEEHVHPVQRERFEVVRGRVAGRINGIDARAAAGESAEIAAGAPHCWWNDGDEEVHVVLEFRPALRTEEFFEKVFALARGGRTDEHGVPTFFHKVALLSEYGDEFRPARLPASVAWLLTRVGGAVVRLRRRPVRMRH